MHHSKILSFKTAAYFWPSNIHGMIFFRRLRIIYAAIIFVLSFLALFPVLVICAQNKKWNRTAYAISHYWAKMFFFLIGVKVKIDDRNKEKWSEPCIYVANHFSYVDIPSMVLLTKNASFVGKQSIKKVPLFGYFFTSLHIALKRDSTRDRGLALQRGFTTLEDGKSLIIFPEGGIRTKNPPNQWNYMDGAFRMAIKKGVPLVPISLPTNYLLLPDDGKLLLKGNNLNIVVHEAIDCSALSDAEVFELKDKVFKIIQSELNLWQQK